VLRGGSWYNGSYFVRAADRFDGFDPSDSSINFGFRCAQETSP
jgi:formylglycine-generating enzyme required for sulfatase activity